MASICFAERCLRGRVVVVDERLACGLDHLGDEVEAGGSGLRAELHVLQVGDSCRTFRRGAGESDDGLVRRVVRVTEVDGLLALVGDRELLQVEIEVLLAGLDGLVESRAHPRDVCIGVAELAGNRVRDGRLVALLGLRLVVLDPRRVGRVAGADGELALGEGLACGAVVAAAGTGRGRSGVAGGVAAAARGEGQRADREEGECNTTHGRPFVGKSVRTGTNLPRAQFGPRQESSRAS